MIQAYMKLSPLIPQLLGKKDQVCVWASDKNQFILMDHPEVTGVDFYVGMPLSENGSQKIAMKQNKVVFRTVPKEVYGTPFRTIAIPVDGGTIGVSVNIEDHERVLESISFLSSLTNDVSKSAQLIAEKSKTQDSMMIRINEHAQNGLNQKKALEQVVGLMKEITDALQILSLNALIEAARAGEYGKTFTVVAKEVKKLSLEGDHQLVEIHQVIDDVIQFLGKITNEVHEMKENTTEQSALTMTIVENVLKVTDHIDTLKELTEQL